MQEQPHANGAFIKNVILKRRSCVTPPLRRLLFGAQLGQTKTWDVLTGGRIANITEAKMRNSPITTLFSHCLYSITFTILQFMF